MKAARHLSETELIDLLDGRADAERRAHADGCQACGARADALREAWALVEADEAPEPSPLFWEHLSARVGRAVRAEAEVERRWPVWRAAFAAVPLLIVVVAVAAVWQLRPADGPSRPRVTSASKSGDLGFGSGVTTAPADDVPSPQADAFASMADDDESWEVVAALSESLGGDFGEVEGFEPRLGAADQAVSQLTVDEQEALAKLLAEVMAGGPSQ